MAIICNLNGECGFDHLEKYESQWEGLSHILWKIKKHETTNQLMGNVVLNGFWQLNVGFLSHRRYEFLIRANTDGDLDAELMYFTMVNRKQFSLLIMVNDC